MHTIKTASSMITGIAMKRVKIAMILCMGLMVEPVFAVFSMDNCLLEQMNSANASATVGELKAICLQLSNNASKETEATTSIKSAIKRRVAFENQQQTNPFSLQAHKPNYIILSNNLDSPNEQPFNDSDPDRGFDFQPWETKFQLSVKLPVARSVIFGGDLFVAYTNRSFLADV
ncbi:MAG: phospholipase A [Gammaproteobacteria bacterium]|nr:phospholipase A [Gammaproteobacteria bacterium]